MKLYPTTFYLYDDQLDKIKAKLTAFDNKSFTVKIEDILFSPDDFIKLAELLTTAEKMLKEGIE